MKSASMMMAVGCAALVLAGAPLHAQGGPPPVPPPGDSPAPAAELQRMFDAYAIVQAQEQLKISDSQYPQFLARYKALLDLRRRTMLGRNRLVGELQRLANDPQSDESRLTDRLKALTELESRSVAETARAYEAIDQVLDARQQARFRAFEDAMERRKLELLTRARQGGRPGGLL